MVLLEAQAAGIPVVAGRSPGVENVVAEGVTGYLSDPGLATFAASVREMLSQKASRVAMAEAGPTLIAEQHSLLAAARRLNAILEEASTSRVRSEEHTSELQSLMRNSYAVFCLKHKKI